MLMRNPMSGDYLVHVLLRMRKSSFIIRANKSGKLKQRDNKSELTFQDGVAGVLLDVKTCLGCQSAEPGNSCRAKDMTEIESLSVKTAPPT